MTFLKVDHRSHRVLLTLEVFEPFHLIQPTLARIEGLLEIRQIRGSRGCEDQWIQSAAFSWTTLI